MIEEHQTRLSSTNLYSFANDGVNIMIDNSWLEEPPQTINKRIFSNQYWYKSDGNQN
ncbi:hypothetical protein [Halalkalibacter flavus]|uniref:hypothetical protein n=1 Tax=Halalkalibacter flavus TaxID=3090668 RepID=UPI002FCA1DC7